MEFQKMYKFDFDFNQSDWYLNCFDPNLHKELQNHPDKILLEFEVIDDEDNDGFIYYYNIMNGGCIIKNILDQCHTKCPGHNLIIEDVEKLLEKHGYLKHT